MAEIINGDDQLDVFREFPWAYLPVNQQIASQINSPHDHHYTTNNFTQRYM